MALKDWKIIKEFGLVIGWLKKDNSDSLYIKYRFNGFVVTRGSSVIENKKFKTKQEAIKLAKKYMRTH